MVEGGKKPYKTGKEGSEKWEKGRNMEGDKDGISMEERRGINIVKKDDKENNEVEGSECGRS